MKQTAFRFIALILAMAMIIPYTAMAAEYDLSAGSITVTGGNDSQTVTHGESAPVADNAPVITQSSAVTNNTITLDGTAADVNVTIQDVNIDTGSSGEAGITTSGDVTIYVDGDNTVTSENTAIDAIGVVTILGNDTVTETETENNTLTVNGDTAIDVDPVTNPTPALGNAIGGTLNVGPDVNVSATGDTTGVDADVFVSGGDLNAYGDVFGTVGSSGTGIDGDLTVQSGAAAVFGEAVGVDGDVTVNENASAIIHSDTNPVAGTMDNSGTLTHSISTYIPNSAGTMQHSYQNASYSTGQTGTIDIQGYFEGVLKQSTYSNCGYETFLRVNENTTQLTDISGNTAVSGLTVKIDVKPTQDGKLLQLVYTVTNTTDEQIDFDLGTGGDIKIGSADSAKIENLYGNTGFSMSEGEDGAVFYFFGVGYDGVTNVDGFWHGYWSSSYPNGWNGNKKTTVFLTTQDECNDDSAASWCWLDESIEANGSATYAVLIGIADAQLKEDMEETLPDYVPDGEAPDNIETPVVAEDIYTGFVPAKKPSVLDIKLDASHETIDLLNGTQAGKAMPTIASEAVLSSGKAIEEDFAIVVRQVSTHAEDTVENLSKEDVGMAFTVACIRDNSVVAMPGKATLSITAPEGDLNGYILVFVLEDGSHIQIPYTLVDGKLVFETAQIGLYMLIKK